MILLLCCAVSFAQTYTVSGTVLNKKTKAPVEFATVVAVECEQWSVADDKGRFTLKNIPAGKNTLSVSCLGFVTDTKTVIISKDLTGYRAFLSEDNLTLEGVVVTAKENENSATTSRTMDRTALDHVQMVSLATSADSCRAERQPTQVCSPPRGSTSGPEEAPRLETRRSERPWRLMA